MLVHCDKCGKTMEDTNFYTYKDGEKTDLCKKCLTLHVDNFDPKTFLWILEKMDVPYLPAEWNVLRDRAYARDPQKMNGTSVLGKYLSKMKLKQWRDYGWADSEMLQERQGNLPKNEDDILLREIELRGRFERGEISEAEYRTLMSTESQLNHDIADGRFAAPIDEALDNPFTEAPVVDDAELDAGIELTQEDKLYLAMKWGNLYKPVEWVQLERKYTEMMASFDIQDADTMNTLMFLCKTDLKMHQALDMGDLDGYAKLSRVYESLRKTAKFTAAQNKEAKNDFVDSVGELVAMCEREGGFIPRFCTDIPQDKVDLTLKDMNDYVKKLVTQDLGFGQQIEDALKKLQIQKEMSAAEEAKMNETDYQGYIEHEDEDYEEFLDTIREQQEEDLDTYGEDEE